MYTSSTFQTKESGRYSYNAFVILNKSPQYLTGNTDPAYQASVISSNFATLRNAFKEQLTQRQYDAIGTVLTYVMSLNAADRMKLLEYRFEGSGVYQGGDPANPSSIDANVSRISVDFRQKNGQHNTAWGTFVPAAKFHEGNGLYGAMSVIYRNGDIIGIFQRASTLPDKMEVADTLKPGSYKFVVGIHPMSGGSSAYKALNLYKLGTTDRTLPALIDNTPDGASGTVSGINSHKGFNYERGSEGCQTITQLDYDAYIALFTTGESGTFIIQHQVSINPADY
ncbi:hypothetical protein [Gorillibacterium timonense]|uniref:hypothetical protein n=1 Tax=Gorillibacterium timonense TaxID=1689269 RepID=UPI00071DDBD9|nr:hypothetical protein [Gorillibacterium timonense]